VHSGPMVRRGLMQLLRVRVTLLYGAILATVTTALASLDPDVQERVFEHASTNLYNLGHGRLGTLLGSAFVVDADSMSLWLPGLLCLLGLAELVWGSGRLVVAFAVGHIGATLLVAAGLLAAVEGGWASREVTEAVDVGTSYGAAAVLGALSAAIPARWRPMWVGWWLGVDVAAVAVGQDFTDVGHGVALVLGMLVALRFGVPAAWVHWRLALLAVSSWFAFLMLASTPEATVAASACGLVGVTVGWLLNRSPLGSRSPLDPGAALSHDS
jgi:hypothetical protein